MLTHLSVRHFATVDQLELEPENGLTVISGETGAGKSVIIDALGLTLGDRADSSIVRHGHDRAEVLATFDVSNNLAARQWLAERELDDEEQCLLRRTVRADGRSRAYVNGTPTPGRTPDQHPQPARTSGAAEKRRPPPAAGQLCRRPRPGQQRARALAPLAESPPRPRRGP